MLHAHMPAPVNDAAAAPSALTEAPTLTHAPSAPVPDFVPTDDWQEVLEGQAIPPGLHVRMDVFKGGRWAKNLAPEDAAGAPAPVAQPAHSASGAAAGGGGALTLVSSEGETSLVPEQAQSLPLQPAAAQGPGQPPALPADEAPEVTAALAGLDPADAARSRILLGLPVPEPTLAGAVASQLPPEQLAALLTRVWDERQAQVRSAWASFKTEGQQMTGLLGTLNAASDGSAPPLSPSDLLDKLEELEYHVSQVHNAEDFAAMGGLARMAQLLNASAAGVAARAAWVIGSAVKGQPSLIDIALADGAGVALAGMLDAALALEGGGLPALPALQALAKGLYAAGALTRYHEAGQAQFAAMGGARILARALQVSLGVLARPPPSQGALGEAARSSALKALHLLADLALNTSSVAAKDAQAPTNALLRFRLEAEAVAGANASGVSTGAEAAAGASGSGSGSGSGAAQKIKVVMLDEAGAVEVGEASGSGGEGGAGVMQAGRSVWLEALQRASAAQTTRALCASARTAIGVLRDQLTEEEVGRIVLPCSAS